ncbi:MAG: hypothetical protein WBM35_00140 [Candidatus Electrothrix sp.]
MKRMRQKILIILFSLYFFPAAVAATELLSESFTACEVPEGWTVENFGGSCDWIFATGLEDNGTGGEGCFAYAKSDKCQDQPMDTALTASSVDCSNITGTTLSFKYDIYSQKSDTEFAVWLSLDGGNSWEEKWARNGEALADNQTALIDISEEADGQADVQIRFRYTASGDWWWQVDDVVMSSSETGKFNWLLFLPAIIGKKSS